MNERFYELVPKKIMELMQSRDKENQKLAFILSEHPRLLYLWMHGTKYETSKLDIPWARCFDTDSDENYVLDDYELPVTIDVDIPNESYPNEFIEELIFCSNNVLQRNMGKDSSSES